MMELISSLLFVITICSVCIIFSQKSKLKEAKEKNEDLRSIERLYQDLLLEKTILAERCRQLQETSSKYNLLLEKYSELEKESVLLSSNLEQERKNLQEKVKLLENAEQKLSNTFKSISLDALSQNNQAFLELAKSVFEKIQEKTKSEFSMGTKSMGDLVVPIKTALEGVNEKINDLEKSRIGAYESLKQQVGDLITTQKSLKEETHHLVSALKTPTVRGRWGEMQLRRVVELAGMVEHCDFKEQVHVESKDGDKIRPDMVIYLPGGQQIIVDAKVPLAAYMEAMEAKDEQHRKMLLKEHAKQIRAHVSVMASKKYWEQFETGPEFVILFLPGEIFFSAAMEQDPSLMEFAMRQRVIISTPTMLLALLHSIALGWRQENLTQNAKQIIKMGQELYKRLSDMSQHISALGKNINSAVQSYNSTIASMESRVLVTARKFKELEVHEKNIVELNSVGSTVRLPQQ